MRGLISDPSEEGILYFATDARDRLDSLATGSSELRITVDALRTITAMVNFHLKSASPSPERADSPPMGSLANTKSIVATRKKKKRGFFGALFGSAKSSDAPMKADPKLSMEVALDIVSHTLQVVRHVCLVGAAPSDVNDIDMTKLPDGSGALAGSLTAGASKQLIFKQYDTTVDLGCCPQMTQLTLRNCRVIAIRGVSRVVELTLMHSTILLPPAELERHNLRREESSSDLDDQDGMEAAVAVDNMSTIPDLPGADGSQLPSDMSFQSSRSIASTAADDSRGDYQTSQSRSRRGGKRHYTWDGFESLQIVRCLDCLVPLFPIPPFGLAMCSEQVRQLVMNKSVNASAFAFARPYSHQLTNTVQHTYWQQLADVDLSGNHIERLNPSWSLLRQLQRLNLSDNALTHLDESLRGCERLNTVNLRANKLIDVSNAVACFPSVTKLDVSQNELMSVIGIARLEKLKTLSINSNKLTFWSDLRLLSLHCPDLDNLSFSDNPMCLFVFRDDQGKLARALFWSHKHMRINGLTPTQLTTKHQIDMLQRYEAIFRESSLVGTSTVTDASPTIPTAMYKDPVIGMLGDDEPLPLPPSRGVSMRSMESASIPLDGTASSVASGGRRRVVKRIRKVKKKSTATVKNEDDEGEESDGNSAIAARMRADSTLPVDPLTGDKADPTELKKKYGDKWLEVYRTLLPAAPPKRNPDAKSNQSDSTSVTDELDGSVREQEASRSATPPPPPPPTHFEPLSTEDFDKVVTAALAKFIQRIVDAECYSWRNPDGSLMHQGGLYWKTLEVASERKPDAGSDDDEEDDSKPRNPLLEYPSQSIWQTVPGRPTPEIWLKAEDEEIPLAASRYDGCTLVRVDEFQYEHGVGFVVRLKEIPEESETLPLVNFPRPALTSMHFSPAAAGRSQYANELKFENVSTEDDKEKCAVDLTRAQMANLTSIFSQPTSPQMICGFVLPSVPTARSLLKTIHAKLELFRNPHYIPQPSDWPLYAEPELSAEVDLMVGVKEVEFTIETEDNELWEKAADIDSSDSAQLLAKQRMGAELRVQCDELTMYISSTVIPRERHGGAAEAVGAIEVIGTTWTNIVDSNTGIEESCFVVVLTTTICIARDANWEGSTVALDNIYDSMLTYQLYQLEVVFIGFGGNYVSLDFGDGMPDVLMMFRDPTLTLRFLSHLKRVVHDQVRFMQMPWPEESPLEHIIGGIVGYNPRSSDTAADTPLLSPVAPAGDVPSTPESPKVQSPSSLPSSPRGLDSPKKLNKSHSQVSLSDSQNAWTTFSDSTLVCGYFNAFVAHFPVFQGDSEKPSSPVTRTGKTARMMKRLVRRGKEGIKSAAHLGMGKSASPESSMRSDRPTSYSPQSSILTEQTALHFADATTINQSSGSLVTNPSSIFPLRHIHDDDSNLEWDRLSLLLSGDGRKLLFMEEEHHTWPYKVDELAYANVANVIEISKISWCEVTPPSSVFPLMIVLSVGGSDPASPPERYIIVFQMRTALEAFLEKLDQCFRRASGTDTPLMRTQLRTAAFGSEDNTPRNLMRLLLRGNTLRRGAEMASQVNKSNVAETSLFGASSRNM